jgi:Family of unknown function (DUF6338)
MAVPGVGEPAEHLVDFLVYVMPGFIALQLFRAKYPAKKLSEFLQVAWSLIYGVILATLIRGLDGRFLRGRLQSNTAGFPASSFVIALALAGLFGGIVLIGLNYARFFAAARWPRWEGIAPDPKSIWAKVNRPTNDYAVVYVDDGSIYFGWIKDFTFDPDAQDNDFLLADAKRVDEQLIEKYSVTGQGVYLNTRNVKRIEFL